MPAAPVESSAAQRHRWGADPAAPADLRDRRAALAWHDAWLPRLGRLGRCDRTDRDGSTFDGWTELGAKRAQLLGRLERRRLQPSGELDEDGNPVPVRRHHPEQPRRTRPRRFAL